MVDLSAMPKAVPLVRWSATGYTPNGWSYRHVHTRGERFITGTTTRQCGKTTTADDEVDSRMRADADLVFGPPAIGVLSFDYAHSWLLVDRWLSRVRKTDGRDRYYLNKNDKLIVDRKTEATLRWFSDDDPSAIAGYTLSDLIIDESQRVSDEVWGKARPTLNNRQARVLAFGTPDTAPNQSWFRGLWRRGQDPDEPNYYSFSVSCFENPWISLDEIRDARSGVTEDEFRMLYLGQWLRADGTVFRHFEDCFSGQWEEPRGGGRYMLSLDLAKEQDYTVCYVWDLDTGAVVHEYRINRLDYTDVEDHVDDLYRRYKASYLVMDVLGPGEPVADALRRRNGNILIRPFKANSRTKQQMISNLARMLEHQQITVPQDAVGLKAELSEFTSSVSP